MEKTSTSELTKQISVERMAREADKIYGITNALDRSIMAEDGRSVLELCGAFMAAEDIARGLSNDLSELADRLNGEKWQ